MDTQSYPVERLPSTKKLLTGLSTGPPTHWLHTLAVLLGHAMVVPLGFAAAALRSPPPGRLAEVRQKRQNPGRTRHVTSRHVYAVPSGIRCWFASGSKQRVYSGRACGGSAAQGGRLWVRVVGSRQFRWARHSAGRMSVVHARPESHSQHISLAHGRYPGSDHIRAGRVRLSGGPGGLPHKEALNGALSEPRTPALA